MGSLIESKTLTVIVAQTCSVPRAGPAERICRDSARHREDAQEQQMVLILRRSVTMGLEESNTASHGVSTGFSESEIINRTIACF